MKKENIKALIVLHLMLMIYSLSGVCSKLAAQTSFISKKFLLYYSIVIILLGMYALVWQQVIKRMPLTMAFANKAITIVWGIIWGRVFFQEIISLGKIVGAVLVVLGIVIFSTMEEESEHHE